MTKREYVKLAINHKESGVVPYYIQFTSDAAQKVCDYYGSNNMDKVIGNYVYGIYPCPWWQYWEVGKFGTFRKYEVPEPPNYLPPVRGTGSYEKFGDLLKDIKERTGCYILVLIYGSYFEKAWELRGAENWLSDIMINKTFAKKLLNDILSKNLVMLENILSFEEIDGVLVGGDWGSQRALFINPELWRELIAPGEMKEYELIKSAGKDVWIHSCGNIEEIIPDLADMGVDVLNPIQPEAMDIYKIKRIFGDRLTFWGGINTQQVLPFGTTVDVKEEVMKIVSFMSKKGGYISSPAQHVQGDVPIENIITLIETIKSFKAEI